MSEPRKVLVARDPSDGLWIVAYATFADLHDEHYNAADDDWIAEGVGTWERAMRIACATVGIGWPSCP